MTDGTTAPAAATPPAPTNAHADAAPELLATGETAPVGTDPTGVERP